VFVSEDRHSLVYRNFLIDDSISYVETVMRCKDGKLLFFTQVNLLVSKLFLGLHL